MQNRQKPKFKLRRLMEEISEEEFFAGWLIEIEYYLWSIIQKDNKANLTSMPYLYDKYAKDLLSLSEQAKGWWFWNTNTYNQYDSWLEDFCDKQIGEDFINLPDWLELYNKWEYKP